MATVSQSLDPESLVARIIAELQATPGAQTLLLRAMLTNEFRGMPLRLERIESDIAELKSDVAVLKTDVAVLKTDVAVLKTDVAVLKTDVAVLKTDVAVLKTDVAVLKTDVAVLKADVAVLKTDVAVLKTDVAVLKADVADLKTRVGRLEVDVSVLKGDSLEVKLHRRIRPLVSQRLGLRRPQVLHSPVSDTESELYEPVEEALDNGFITDAQDTRISATDIILRAQRKDDRAPVWVAVEVSNDISQRDIKRVRQSADALSSVFRQDALAVVVGYRLHPQDMKRARQADVHTLLIGEDD